MNYMMSHSLYATHNAKDALLDANALKNLIKRFNPSATYSNLLKTVQGLDALAAYRASK